jgi:hypothetical protein
MLKTEGAICWVIGSWNDLTRSAQMERKTIQTRDLLPDKMTSALDSNPEYTRGLVHEIWVNPCEISEDFDEQGWYKKVYSPDSYDYPSGWVTVNGNLHSSYWTNYRFKPRMRIHRNEDYDRLRSLTRFMVIKEIRSLVNLLGIVFASHCFLNVFGLSMDKLILCIISRRVLMLSGFWMFINGLWLFRFTSWIDCGGLPFGYYGSKMQFIGWCIG